MQLILGKLAMDMPHVAVLNYFQAKKEVFTGISLKVGGCEATLTR